MSDEVCRGIRYGAQFLEGPTLKYGAPFMNPEKSDEEELASDELPAAWKPVFEDPYPGNYYPTSEDPPCESRFLSRAQHFLRNLPHSADDEVALADLLDDVYIRGRYDERRG